jgi:hypothetical protein
MEQSILKSTKKLLQIGSDDDSFDLDIMTHINSAFSTLHQVGVGPYAGFAIEDDTANWDEFLDPGPMQNQVKSFVFLHSRLRFDPPATPFLINAVQEQLQEATWRISVMREETDWVDPNPVPASLDDLFEGHVPIIDAGGA